MTLKLFFIIFMSAALVFSSCENPKCGVSCIEILNTQGDLLVCNCDLDLEEGITIEVNTCEEVE